MGDFLAFRARKDPQMGLTLDAGSKALSFHFQETMMVWTRHVRQ